MKAGTRCFNASWSRFAKVGSTKTRLGSFRRTADASDFTCGTAWPMWLLGNDAWYWGGHIGNYILTILSILQLLQSKGKFSAYGFISYVGEEIVGDKSWWQLNFAGWPDCQPATQCELHIIVSDISVGSVGSKHRPESCWIFTGRSALMWILYDSLQYL